MERKSMGNFLAALRKANGLTQKDLADQLNLSDKTISRWERDENAPDLSLIPVLAEIFDVTCDELLCGERKPKQQVDNTESPRKQKQLKRILDDSLHTLRNQSYIAMAITAIGIICGLIANFGFLAAQIGFFLSLALFVVAGLYQCICSNNASYRMRSESFDEGQIQPYRGQQFDLNVRSSLWLFTAILVMVPLLLVEDAYMGLSENSFFPWTLLAALAVALLYHLLLKGFLTKIALKKGIYVETEAILKSQRLQKLKNKSATVTAVACALTLLIQIVYAGTCSALTFADHESFTNLDDFVTYMAIETDPIYYNEYGGISDAPVSASDNAIYYDKYGNEISEYEHRTKTIYNNDGTVLCTYQHNNQEIINYRFTWSGDELTEIRTYTAQDNRAGWDTYDYYGNLINLGYPISLCLGALYYILNKKKYQ